MNHPRSELESNSSLGFEYKTKTKTRSILITVLLGTIVLFVLPASLFGSPVPALDRKVWRTLISRTTVSESDDYVYKAVAVLHGTTPVTGIVTFEQPVVDGPVTISGTLRNLDPSSQRGFHVHEYGNLTDGCASTGYHYNPYNATHGAPTDSVSDGKRHVGDLGNVVSDGNGVATFSFTDEGMSLNGFRSIVGRTMIVHEGQDDLGKGGTPESLKTGNSGGRAACGVIGRA